MNFKLLKRESVKSRCLWQIFDNVVVTICLVTTIFIFLPNKKSEIRALKKDQIDNLTLRKAKQLLK